ncbi:LamG domain-containing protein [Streptosporangium jomthongense]|uniref:LamG domain-containing protein n=2 Tax=Streptosporangium jomthongense TaxID=1193683 RepID=A0ABV8F555_9ACTN
MIIGMVSATGTPAAAQSPPTAAPDCAESVPRTDAAIKMSRACKTRVEVESERTPTTQVFVNPDGSSTVEQYAHPRRVRQADGTWTKPDPTLAPGTDGLLRPRASTVDVRLSGGGTGPLVRAVQGKAELALSWPSSLPQPTVSDARATYPDVLDGVDLVVTALDTGFSFVLVVKTREAAKNPALREITLPTALTGLKWDGPRAVDKQGRTVFAADAPAMWDSSGKQPSTAAAPAEDARSAPVELGVAAGRGLTLKPDTALLTDPKTTFPLFIDPTVGYTYWTMINEAAPNQSYWDYDRRNCSGGWDTDCAKVGYYPSGNDGATYSRYRSMFQFSAAPFSGKQILAGSRFTIDLLSSTSCSDSTTWLHTVGTTLGPGTTWNAEFSKWSGTEVSSVANNSCQYARKFTEFPLDSWVVSGRQYGGWLTLGLRADDEDSSSGWKKFDATTARLIVNTNTVPSPPGSLTVDGKACATGGERPYVSTLTPSWRAYLADGDGEAMTASFYWQAIDPAGAQQGPLTQSSVGSGTTAVVTPTSGIADNTAYRFWARASDANATSDESVKCEFVTDTVRPQTATVTSDVYPESDNVAGGVGQTGKFTFQSSPDVASYKWGFSDPPSTVAIPTSVGAPVTVGWTPTEGGAHTLYVVAVDRAGNQSPRRTHSFVVGSPEPELARWLLNDAPGSATAFDDTDKGRALTINGGATLGEPGRLAPGPDGRSRSALRVDSADDYASRADFLNTATSFTVSAWVKLAGKGADSTVVSQRGTGNRAFFLSYLAAQDRWAMTIPSQDTAGATASSALSTTVPRAGVWTHLTGVYDAGIRSVQLYVNGTLEATVGDVTAWDASGAFQVGGGWGGSPLDGAVAEVRAWNRAIATTEAAAIADPTLNSKVAEWHFEEVGPGPAHDSSGMFRDLTFYGGVQVPPSGAGHGGATGLRLDGVDDYVAPDDPVVLTDQSFTVSTWVRPSDLIRAQTFVSGGFTLYYEPGGDGKWVFSMPASATDTANSTFAITSVANPTEYHHLVGIFDAQQRHLRLYVDGALKVTVGMRPQWQPWRSQQPLLIGKGASGGFVKGDLDEIQIFQGVVPDVAGPTGVVRGLVDFNGDGKADFCRRVGAVPNSKVACTLSTGSGYGITITSGVLDWGQDAGRAWVDVNGDGKTDFCRLRGTQNHVDAYASCTLSTGSAFGMEVNSRNFDRGFPEDRAWVDATGDGKIDYCRRVGGVPESRLACTPFTSGGFGETFISDVLDWGQTTGRAWVDVNSDGKADYCRIRGTQNHTDGYLSCAPSTGTGFGRDVNSGNTDWGYTEDRSWTDVNGDGNADYCRSVGATSARTIACNTSTGTGFGPLFLSGALDWGQATGRAWVDATGDGKADFCRVFGTQNHVDTHVGCLTSTGTGFGAEITSDTIDQGYPEGRNWSDANGDGKIDYCRRTGFATDQKVGCTPATGTGFGTSFYSGALDWGLVN